LTDKLSNGAAVRDLYVTWDQYHKLTEKLARQIHESGWQFNQLICIARGGLRVGDVLSRIYDLPLAILSTSSYSEKAGTVRGELIIADQMTMASGRLGDRVLLVDDLVDSGVTLEAVTRTLPQRYPQVTALRTAVLWYKAGSVFKPDYFVEHLPDNPWIHQPFEIYDTMRPKDIPGDT
jgi:hypoxanthine phosphoribosyltransferase